MTTRVIGLSGPIGCGKDTVAQILRAHVRSTQCFAFADKLREEVVDAFCIEQTFLTRRDTKERPMPALALNRCMDRDFIRALARAGVNAEMQAPRSPRQIMQWWGTEYRRAQEPGYWVTRAGQHIAWLRQTVNPRLIVVTDVRYQDEANMLHALGGQIWQITRPGHEAKAATHSSEVTGEDFLPTEVIDNSGNKHDLLQLVLGAWAAREWSLPGVRVTVPALQEEGVA